MGNLKMVNQALRSSPSSPTRTCLRLQHPTLKVRAPYGALGKHVEEATYETFDDISLPRT